MASPSPLASSPLVKADRSPGTRPCSEKNNSKSMSKVRQCPSSFTRDAARPSFSAMRSSRGRWRNASVASRTSVVLTGTPAARSSSTNSENVAKSPPPSTSSAARVPDWVEVKARSQSRLGRSQGSVAVKARSKSRLGRSQGRASPAVIPPPPRAPWPPVRCRSGTSAAR